VAEVPAFGAIGAISLHPTVVTAQLSILVLILLKKIFTITAMAAFVTLSGGFFLL
jgi:hypothetical protein